MSRKFNVLTSTLAVLAITISAASVAKADTAGKVTFKFDPPDGTVVNYVITNITSSVGANGKDTKKIISRERRQYKKNTSGCSVISTPLEVKMLLNDKEVKGNPIINAVIGVSMTEEITSDGRLKNIDLPTAPFDRFIEENKSNPSASAMASAVRESLITAAKWEWESRVEQFVGRTAAIGELWMSTPDRNVADDIRMPVKMRTRLVEMVERDGRTCAKLRFHYDADTEKLIAEASKVISDELASVPDTEDVTIDVISAKASGDGEAIIDPQTMLFIGENWTESLQITMLVNGETKSNYSIFRKREVTSKISTSDAN